MNNSKQQGAGQKKAVTYSPPLSPHLSVYKPQLTSVLSILHRATGVSLALGSLLVCIWLVAILAGPDYFNAIQSIIRSWLGQIVLFAWSWALIYHLCNGIRHLCWDIGLGLNIKDTYKSGWAVLSTSIASTLIIWSTAA